MQYSRHCYCYIAFDGTNTALTHIQFYIRFVQRRLNEYVPIVVIVVVVDDRAIAAAFGPVAKDTNYYDIIILSTMTPFRGVLF